jgi:hypothetical protein
MADDQKPTWITSKEPTPQVYTNFVHTSWTLFDVRFQLGQLVPSEPGASNAFVVEDQGAVTLAWPAAKNLRDTLISLIDSYEKTNGEIKPIKLTPVPAAKPLAR